MIFNDILKKFFYIYYNPRLVFIEINQKNLTVKYEKSAYRKYNLCFLNKYSKIKYYAYSLVDFLIEKTDIYDQYSDEDAEREGHFYRILSSFVMVFHIDVNQLYNKTCIDNKALALYQLSRNCVSPLNDKVRESYIFYLLYNAHLYSEQLDCLKFRKGVLFFNVNGKTYIPLKDMIKSIRLYKYQKHDNEFLSCIKNFYIEFINFLENGSDSPPLEGLIDDEYLPICHYKNFINHRVNGLNKRVSTKKIFSALPMMVEPSQSTQNEFVSSMILFNYMNLLYDRTGNNLKKYLEGQGTFSSTFPQIINNFDNLFKFYSKEKRNNIKRFIENYN